MYGDTDVMRRRAAQLREQGVDIRAMAERLVAQTERVDWAGRAADSLGERIRERAVHLRDVAARHDGAADLLETHLHEVDRLKDAISAAELRARGLVTDAPRDRGATSFAPPPSGHKDWLAVDLPGL